MLITHNSENQPITSGDATVIWLLNTQSFFKDSRWPETAGSSFKVLFPKSSSASLQTLHAEKIFNYKSVCSINMFEDVLENFQPLRELTCFRQRSSPGSLLMELLFNSRTERFVNLETLLGTCFIFFEFKFKVLIYITYYNIYLKCLYISMVT